MFPVLGSIWNRSVWSASAYVTYEKTGTKLCQFRVVLPRPDSGQNAIWTLRRLTKICIILTAKKTPKSRTANYTEDQYNGWTSVKFLSSLFLLAAATTGNEYFFPAHLIVCFGAVGIDGSNLHYRCSRRLVFQDAAPDDLRKRGNVIVDIFDLNVDCGRSRKTIFILHTNCERVFGYALVVEQPTQLHHCLGT